MAPAEPSPLGRSKMTRPTSIRHTRRRIPSGQDKLPFQVQTPPPSQGEMVAVLDMGASATRLVVIEIAPDRTVRTLEEASRGILLGRDTFSSGVIRSSTIDAVISALDGFRHVIEDTPSRASARWRPAPCAKPGTWMCSWTASAAGRASSSRSSTRPRKPSPLPGRPPDAPPARGAASCVDAADRGRRRQHQRHAAPAGPTAPIGGLRARRHPAAAALHLQRLTHDVQLAILKRSIANVIEEIRLDIPMRRVSQLIAIGGDVRFAAAQILRRDRGRRAARSRPGTSSSRSAIEIERLDEEQLSSGFDCRRSQAETLLPSLLVYRDAARRDGARAR